MPTFGSLFAGIGGFDLGLERAGWTPRWQVEIDAFCQRVLAKHWPSVPRHGDIRSFPAADTERVDLICGGFPCQDVSSAGARVGIGGERSGLWREFSRVVSVLRPRYVLVENVSGLLARGMGVVLGDLAGIGYDAEWSVIPACALGAPHPRERVFVVAYADSERERQLRRLECAPLRSGEWNLRRSSAEPGIERVVDGLPDRVDRNRAIGNSIVPQVAEWIGRRLMSIALAGEAPVASPPRARQELHI